MSNASFNRPGAIDLSQLAAKATSPAGQPAGQSGRPGQSGQGAGRPGGPGGRFVLEVNDQTFETEIIRRSAQYPVVVEFYSPRVGPSGDLLSADLAALAEEAGGKWLLARLNTDGSQIPQAIGIQAVPTVIGVVGGQLAPLFQGAQRKEEAKAFIEQLVKAAVANGIVGRAEPVGGPSEPAGAEDDAGEPDPRFAAADEALERGDYAAAEAEFDRLLAADSSDAEARAGKAQAGLLARTSSLDSATVLADAAAGNATVEQQLAAADVELAGGRADEAFERLLRVVRTSAGPDREAARVRLLELFETLGNADPRVQKARRDLMTALF